MVSRSRTLEQTRLDVGRLLGAVKLGTATGGTTATLVDSSLRGGDNAKNGKFYRLTSGSDDAVQRQASDYVQSTTTVTVAPAWTTGPSNAVTYEEWDEWADPVDVVAMINQAILDASGFFFDPTEDITFHTGSTYRYDLAATLDMISDVLLRTAMTSQQVLEAGAVWDESVDADFTITQDDEDKLYGRVTTKFVIAGTISDGDLASQAIASLDLSNQTHIEFPIKARIAVAASDLILRLSATANGADTDKLIAVPALVVGAETWVRVAMTEAVSSFDPSETTAIISVALEYNANSGGNTIWLGEIRGTREDSYTWESVPRHLWKVDKEARDLIFEPPIRDSLGYHLMKLVGGDNPLILSADADVSEVPDSYIIYQAAGLMAQRHGVPTGVAERASGFLRLASDAKKSFRPLVNARLVS